MKVLFIGATGTIGSKIVPLLAQQFDLTLAAHVEGEMEGLPVKQADITDMSSVEELVKAGTSNGEPFDAVINCAIADYRNFRIRNREEVHDYNLRCIEVNAKGAYQIYEAAWRARIRRVVYISSLSILRGEPRYTRFDVDTIDRPRAVYGAAKAFGEHIGRDYAYGPEHRGHTLEVVCLRLGHPIWHEAEQKKHLFYLPEHLPVDMRDIASAVDCALRVPAKYAIYSIISQVEPEFVDSRLYEGLGYKPAWRFTRDGVEPAIY